MKQPEVKKGQRWADNSTSGRVVEVMAIYGDTVEIMNVISAKRVNAQKKRFNGTTRGYTWINSGRK